MTMASAIYADMFADMYRLEREQKAAMAPGIAGSHAFTSDEHCAKDANTSLASLRNPHNTGAAASNSTTTPPQTPRSMSSEHSFMAASTQAQQPSPLAAQPGGIAPYVPHPPRRIPLP